MKSDIKNKDLKRRIIEISYKYKLSHLGSCLTAVDIIDEIYATKKSSEKFILSSGHAGLALYCVLEKYNSDSIGLVGLHNAEDMFKHHGVHPDLCTRCGIDCSAGSLGNGLPIAVGMALADRSKNVYCLISDGECSEGSIWEAMRIKEEQKLDNLKVYLNWNGYAAYKETPFPDVLIGDISSVKRQAKSIYYPSNIDNIRINNMKDYPIWLQSQQAHYYVMQEKDYKLAMELLK